MVTFSTEYQYDSLIHAYTHTHSGVPLHAWIPEIALSLPEVMSHSVY